jgi:hypothetical protein
MDQFCELQLRIDKLDRSIAASESEEAKLAQECDILRSELALEEENERVRREEALLLQQACVKHEVSCRYWNILCIKRESCCTTRIFASGLKIDEIVVPHGPCMTDNRC